MKEIAHALVLNFHQPANNLEHLLDHNSWEAKEILYSLDRIPRSLWGFEDRARIHLSLSGSLLETLANPVFQERAYGIVDCGSLLWYLQNRQFFNILGSAYYHPVLPLVPQADCKAHLERWLSIASHLFWRTNYGGFWPPEMGFSMELIPLVKQMGYRYVIIDSENIRPISSMTWHEMRYRPHVARHQDEEIIVIVRDRELSNAQESGMEYQWFAKEVRERTKWCNFTPLVTTATDGDNGGWFRNCQPEANFWGAFYRELLEHARHDANPIQPQFIDDYLDQHGTLGEVAIETAAWNTGWHDGKAFIQWTGSQRQKEALRQAHEISQAFHQTAESAKGKPPVEAHHQLGEAYWRLLRAQTSCHFFWGEAWVHKCDNDLNHAWRHLNEAIRQFSNTARVNC